MSTRKGITLVELLIVVVILGVLAMLAIPRIGTSAANAKTNTCEVNKDVINSQCELYYATESAWPADIDALCSDTDYFPDGEPCCPGSGVYSLDANHRAACSVH